MIAMILFKEKRMDKRVYQKLEFDKILKMLSEKAMSDIGRKAALVLKPQVDIDGVMRLQNETLEAESILMRKPSSPMQSFSDISAETMRLRTGADLGCGELLRVLGVQKAARRAKKSITDTDDSAKILCQLAQMLYYCDTTISELDNAIISEDALADTASHELFSIRKKILRENEGIREKLSAIIRSPQHKDHLQDAIVTMRGGRYVVPIKQEHKKSLKGLVHDQSASGQTVFIEPMDVVEANNKLRELELAEAAEIARILHAFSDRLREHWELLRDDLEILTRLDVIFAKASLASAMKASPPTITEERKMIVKNGRHPLINATVVVPRVVVY